MDTVKKACGHDIYLGESFYHSCGYYFHSEEGPRWLRLSLIPETTPKEAAEHHDRKLVESLGDKVSGVVLTAPACGAPMDLEKKIQKFLAPLIDMTLPRAKVSNFLAFFWFCQEAIFDEWMIA